MRWPARILRLPHSALVRLRRFIEARAGASDPGSTALACLACLRPASRCLCVCGPTLEEPIGDQHSVPTRPDSARAKAIVPGPPKPPSSFPPPRRGGR